MGPLLVLVIVLPLALLLLGISIGVAAAQWWARRTASQHDLQWLQAAAGEVDEEAACVLPSGVPSSTAALPAGRKDSWPRSKLLQGVHIVASSASLQPSSVSVPSSEAALPLGLRLVSASPPRPQRTSHESVGRGAARRAAATAKQRGSPGAAATDAAAALAPQGSGLASVGLSSPGGLAHRKTLSLDLGQLVRAGPSVISQVMEEWEARSTLYRIMSCDTFNLPSPQQAAAAAAAAHQGLLSPAAAALFNPAAGCGAPMAAMPSGEVHMDEIDLQECIGKGGYGCVYKASWRGAGVAVKYIVCPTDDADSLGRAIREVVLSKKMSHPNVVQCYSWTVLSGPEPAAESTPTSRTGASSPRALSFTSRQHLTGGARRGLDQRFIAVADGSSSGGDSGAAGFGLPRPASLHRITERPTQEEGRTLQQEIEALLAAEAAVPQTADDAGMGVPQLQREQQQQQQQQQSPPAEQQQQEQPASPAAAFEGMQPAASEMARGEPSATPEPEGEQGQSDSSNDAYKQQLLAGKRLLRSSRSPTGSPGIQAVHAGQGDACQLAEVAEGHADGEMDEVVGDVVTTQPADLQLLDPQQQAGAEPEPDSLPASPFASRAAQAGPLRRTSDGSSGAESAAGGGAAAQQQQQEWRQLQRQQQASEEDEGEDVYARFASYEEMVAHFQQLAAEGQALQQQEQLLQAAAAAGWPGDGMSRSSSLRLDPADSGVPGIVTAASSFSDVLSMNGFMLEGTSTGAEQSVLSLPSSPRYHQQRSGQSTGSSWFHPSVPSAASSRPTTPRAGGLVGGPSRLARSASAAPAPQQWQAVPGGLALAMAASMPAPSWQAAEEAAEQQQQQQDLEGQSQVATDGAACPAATGVQQQLTEVQLAMLPTPGCQPGVADQQPQQHVQVHHRSSQGLPTIESSAQLAALQAGSAGLHCSSTVSLSMWQAAVPAAAGPAAVDIDNGGRLAGQQPCGSISPAAAAQQGAASACPAASPQAFCAAGPCSQEQPQQQHSLQVPRLGAGGVDGGSGTVTPRMGSVSSLGPAASPVLDASQQVTPRQQSLRGPAGLQPSPRQDSVRSAGGARSGRHRVEELREEAAAAGASGDCTSCDRLSLGSHNDSFNSEEGFGSPVKQRCGGVKDVFQLEELQLSGQEALMVVVMEYCDLGSLRKAVKRKAFRPSAKWPFQTTYRALLRTAQEVAKGMGYIHEFNIVHGDLKPGNVLLKTHKVDRRGYIAKVSDFGLSRPLDMEETHASLGNALGTIAYTAPETFAHNCLKKPSDVYAFGIMLWEMFYCKEPYEGLLDGQICVGVTDGSLRPEFDEDCPEAYRRLAERCWDQDPERRPTFEEIDRELVRIEMEFRLLRHRANSKRASSAASQATVAGGGSLPSSRPGSPRVQPRGGGGPARQFQASALAD